jgi:Kef-type K+ transport system membrane component KefB
MNPYHILIVLCALVVVSYLFNLVSDFLRIPAVLLLIGLGMLLKEAGNAAGFELPDTRVVVELLGITGLVLIVLEGALDLKISAEKRPVIVSSFLAALLILLVCSGLIALVLHLLTGMSWRSSIVYAVPLGVISSAIAIPSVGRLQQAKREFIIYESSFSDILGIMLFNYVVLENWDSIGSVGYFFLGIIGIIALAVVSTLFFLWLLNRTSSHNKMFLMLAILMLIYAISKLVHWPSLMLVLLFGLAMNNTGLFLKGKLKNVFNPEKLKTINEEVKMLTGESAFLIRTFFFVLFGYSIEITRLNDVHAITTGLAILAAILMTRFVFLRFISRTNVFPEIFIAPRGLISIILFYGIPVALQNPAFNDGILLFVILGSNILMVIGLLFSGKKYAREMDEL